METKNRAIIRKHMGFTHIAAQYTVAVDQFHRQYLNPYPPRSSKPNGKRRRLYRRWATPFGIIGQAPQCESYLRPGVNMAELERFAKTQSDTEAHRDATSTERKLLTGVRKRTA